jgi:lipopolysaccharide/colanic/teichoic acid biosynthesis glycosyltransferase
VSRRSDSVLKNGTVVSGLMAPSAGRMVRNLCIGKTRPPLVSRSGWRRPGLTGLWQINGRSGVTTTLALRLDLVSIENWSLSLDPAS